MSRLLARVEPLLTRRQFKFVTLKIQWPYPPSSKCARAAGYAESVARHANDIIVRGSPITPPSGCPSVDSVTFLILFPEMCMPRDSALPADLISSD